MQQVSPESTKVVEAECVRKHEAHSPGRGGDGWKAKVLSSEQPFRDEQQTESWLPAKADYKTHKAEGEV